MKKNDSNIKKAIKYLNNNDCIAIPTETVYGLAGNAYSDKAVSRIYKLKKRPKNNPLIVHYYSLNDLKKDCKIENTFDKLFKKFCPGPISFVLRLKKTSKISKIITNNSNSIAVRFPSHPLTRKLLNKINYPLAAPSANISTSISPVSKQDVVDEFGPKLKFILDGGSSKVGIESTIINLIGKPHILRLGGINSKLIYKLINSLENKSKKIIKIKVPGTSKLHYSPGIPVRLNAKKNFLNEAFILIKKRRNLNKNYFYLSKTNNLKEAAKNLYKIFRVIKKKGYKKIAIEKIPNINIGEAINDRILRASKK
ncbi:threonylcarbamoyl-AMP synthase [Pelagibacterales bacterium SAG-MED17]|nr:threonylcarbamoyl-AMP synthase [Pelagibacterales bacterium SAG-MED17]